MAKGQYQSRIGKEIEERFKTQTEEAPVKNEPAEIKAAPAAVSEEPRKKDGMRSRLTKAQRERVNIKDVPIDDIELYETRSVQVNLLFCPTVIEKIRAYSKANGISQNTIFNDLAKEFIKENNL